MKQVEVTIKKRFKGRTCDRVRQRLAQFIDSVNTPPPFEDQPEPVNMMVVFSFVQSVCNEVPSKMGAGYLTVSEFSVVMDEKQRCISVYVRGHTNQDVLWMEITRLSGQ